MRHQVGIGDKHARGIRVCLKNADRFTGLDEEGFIIFQRFKRFQDGIEAIPIAGGLTAPAIDHQLQRPLGYFGIQVVLDHAESGFGLPGFAGELGTSGSLNRAGIGHDIPLI